MAPDDGLSGEHERASQELLLSPLRALAFFAVVIVALLGVGGLLLGGLIETRTGKTRMSATLVATATSDPLATSAAQPAAVSKDESQLVQADETLRPTAVPAFRLATPVGEQGAAENTELAASVANPTQDGTSLAAAGSQATPWRPGSQQEALVNSRQTQAGGEGQSGTTPIKPLAGAAVAARRGAGLPGSINLGGSLIPVGSDGVTVPGALRFAQTLAQGARTADGRPVASDAVLDDLAQRVLSGELASAQQRGYPQEDVLSQDGAIVRVELVAVLPHTNDVKLAALPKDARTLGVATGVAQRMEPGYLPDLVVVAAVSYR